MEGILTAWGRILRGYTPSLSIEITRECPLHCPSCYAYGEDHLGGDLRLRELRDFKGQELIDGVLGLVDRHRPLHLSIVGGEPLVRYRELDTLLPILAARGVYTQLVTSAVREIPIAWRDLRRLQIVVSIDGLQPEHDARRTPATYDRILKHIAGHEITVHCTVTRQQVRTAGNHRKVLEFWQAQPDARAYLDELVHAAPGEVSAERLRPIDRERVVADLMALQFRFSKLRMNEHILQAYSEPPASPEDCLFARSTTTISADLTTKITPCQFGGARLQQLRVPRVQPASRRSGGTGSSAYSVESIFVTSVAIGERVRRLLPETA